MIITLPLRSLQLNIFAKWMFLVFFLYTWGTDLEFTRNEVISSFVGVELILTWSIQRILLTFWFLKRETDICISRQGLLIGRCNFVLPVCVWGRGAFDTCMEVFLVFCYHLQKGAAGI